MSVGGVSERYEGKGERQRTKRMPWAFRRVASLSRLARVMSFSAMRCASLALCHVVWMDSYLMSEVTRLRSSAWRCAELRLRCRYLVSPPAILKRDQAVVGRNGSGSSSSVRGGGGVCRRLRPKFLFLAAVWLRQAPVAKSRSPTLFLTLATLQASSHL